MVVMTRNDGLQTFIENFVKDQFLPIVRVDYRTRVADALASEPLNAFLSDWSWHFFGMRLSCISDIELPTWYVTRALRKSCLPSVMMLRLLPTFLFSSLLAYWNGLASPGPSAFRLRSYPGAQYESAVESGRPVLQGPLAANQLVCEVSRRRFYISQLLMIKGFMTARFCSSNGLFSLFLNATSVVSISESIFRFVREAFPTWKLEQIESRNLK